MSATLLPMADPTEKQIPISIRPQNSMERPLSLQEATASIRLLLEGILQEVLGLPQCLDLAGASRLAILVRRVTVVACWLQVTSVLLRSFQLPGYTLPRRLQRPLFLQCTLLLLRLLVGLRLSSSLLNIARLHILLVVVLVGSLLSPGVGL